MGYQALLFCPDDKTARTVTQVLSELEFTVEACIEPFAAVKKLMGQHFDAVVVDCDNEQNATLLFKSARNSTSNQTSLAVAVVEGQAGVAKAFRIGANLVLTKPINIEQAKGTLRVARGLLRKSDPTKPGTATGTFAVPTAPTATPAAAATATPAAPKPAAPKPAAARPAAPGPAAAKPVAPAATSTFKAPQAQTPKPAAPSAWPTAVAAAKSAPAVHDAPASPAVAEKPVAAPTPPAAVALAPLYSAVLATEKPAVTPPVPEFKGPIVTATVASGGAASAPAPAREPQVPRVEEKKAESVAEALFEKPAEAAPASEPQAYVGAAPSFTFGGSTEETESSGGSKKVVIGIAAVVVVAFVGYFGWTQFKGSSSSAPHAVATSAPAATSSAPTLGSQPSTAATEPAKTSPVSQPDITIGPSANSSNESEASTSGSAKPSASASKSANISSTPAKSAVTEKVPAEKEADEEEPATPALVVKGGKVPSVQAKSAAVPDAPAPSLIGMGAPSGSALPNLGTANTEFKPTLQTLSVSQGVSQGLLFKKVAPAYPQNALRMHIEGAVELLATISKTGDITHIKIISGDQQLTKAASDAVKQWKYKPYLLNGEPVEIQTQVTINFKLPH